MPITAFALKYSRLTILVIAFILLAGVQTYLTMPSKEDPTITIRDAKITTNFPGMNPRRIEDLITRKIEEKVREIPEIETVSSNSKAGQSIVTVKVYDRYFDLEPIWQTLRNKMEDVKGELPGGTDGPHVNDDFGDVAVATIALTADGFSHAEMRDTARKLRDRLYTLKGLAKVELHGVQEERIYLEVSNARIAQYGLTPDQLFSALSAQNIILPGGKVFSAGQDILIEPSGNFETLEDIDQVVISIPSTQQVVYLRDLVSARRAYVDPPDKLAFFRGEPTIVLAVQMVEGSNVVEFGERLTARVKLLESRLPIGYQLRFATYQPGIVKKSIDDFAGSLYQTIAIVLAVVMLFLGWRTGLIVGSMVPLTMLLAILVMNTSGIELHKISIASLIISLGLLVDNGIVIAENIGLRLERGVPPDEAAKAATRELGMPLLSSSLTTILAFMPLMLAQNQTGEFLRPLSSVIAVTLLASWLLSMYAAPMLCAKFMKVKVRKAGPKEGPGQEPKPEGRLYDLYQSLLERVLRFRWAFLGLMLGMLVFSGWLAGFLPQQFFPPSERQQVVVYLDLPAGTSSRQTRKSLETFVTWVEDKKANPDIEQSIAYLGYGGPRFVLSLSPPDPDPHRAFAVLDIAPEASVDAMIERIRRYALGNLPELRLKAKRMGQGGTDQGTLIYRFSGPGADQLSAMADKLLAEARTIEGLATLERDWENKVVTLLVKVDQARARRAGVTSEEIAQALSAYFTGYEVTDFREGDKIIPVVIRAEEAERFSLERIGTMNIYSASNKTSVPLLQVATFEPRWDFSRINRRNLERTLSVEVRHSTMQAQALFNRLKPTLDAIPRPPGYEITIGGEIEDSKDAQGALFEFLPLCMALIVVLLVWQFNSFRRPLIIGLTIPLAFIGAVLGLLFSGAFFGFMAILGLLSLAGIIINNAIVLIDRIDIEAAAGRTPYDAIVTAAMTRLRPILMTTLTTILGLMPLMVFGEALWFPMSIVIAAGLAVGTVLTLGVVPVLYALLFRVEIPSADKSPAADKTPAAAKTKPA